MLQQLLYSIFFSLLFFQFPQFPYQQAHFQVIPEWFSFADEEEILSVAYPDLLLLLSEYHFLIPEAGLL